MCLVGIYYHYYQQILLLSTTLNWQGSLKYLVGTQCTVRQEHILELAGTQYTAKLGNTIYLDRDTVYCQSGTQNTARQGHMYCQAEKEFTGSLSAKHCSLYNVITTYSELPLPVPLAVSMKNS